MNPVLLMDGVRGAHALVQRVNRDVVTPDPIPLTPGQGVIDITAPCPVVSRRKGCVLCLPGPHPASPRG